MIKFLRSFLAISWLYTLFGWILGASYSRNEFVKKYVAAKPGDKILDIGCGPGDIIPYLPRGVNYTGFDVSTKYIKTQKC
ncbi:class I SAM-dependent methyltransferase [Spirulina subsalsa FACHB-351]|uniref:Class I SAM-dependent methyltransferase n=1 Tax=Spirulina subsalsa FACHB-351 TaxID=234711 RepID=A0ABT3LAJ2_9CYAN|nr:class I SAM-dependent methyltransferase [Spirulina subsalsa]MCW6038508.1 class I SAM-dependent methyltransferase [Spirulina subsalsa FACHB-351]